jgi:hypothetical protein
MVKNPAKPILLNLNENTKQGKPLGAVKPLLKNGSGASQPIKDRA